MAFNTRILMILFGLLLVVVMMILLQKGKIPIKFSILWFFSGILVFLIGVFPDSLEFVKNMLGFHTLSNMLTGIFITILFILTISLTIIVSSQKNKIQKLIQEISLLKEDAKHKNDTN